MIDNFSILLSSIACLFVVVRAILLDRLTPWFGSVKSAEPDAQAEPRPGPGTTLETCTTNHAQASWRVRASRNRQQAAARRTAR